MTKQFLILHGPNLNALGQREQSIYGNVTLNEINNTLEKYAKTLDINLTIVQSNHEGDIVDCIHQSKDKQISGIIINPAAFTHTSVAIRDAIAAVDIPTVEVHLSNIYSREEFRQHSFIAPVSICQISGLGVNSYIVAIQGLSLHLDNQ